MRTTKTIVGHAYTVQDCQTIMNELGGSPTVGHPFPNMPIEINFQNGMIMKVRETEAFGMDDECSPDERHFVIRVDGIPIVD